MIPGYNTHDTTDASWREFDRTPAGPLIWPEGFVWPSTNYPSRPPPRPVSGWTCPGCGSGYAPHVTRCTECAPKAKADPACMEKEN